LDPSPREFQCKRIGGWYCSTCRCAGSSGEFERGSIKMASTRNSLAIVWDGAEVDGILCYGLDWGACTPEPTFPAASWPNGTLCKPNRLFGEGWVVWMWEVRIIEWPHPSQWESAVLDTLKSFLVAGCLVAWCGLEGAFADPPSLFSVREMTGGVWALVDQVGRRFGPPSLNSALSTLGDNTLKEIQTAHGRGPSPSS
jgi:hypothetical protein